MVRPIVKDIFFLGQKSEIATTADKPVAIDLLDTLKANKKYCVGMAANMIGIKKRIIVVNIGIMDIIMFNPNILSKRNSYETEEGCLSFTGMRKTIRYDEIIVGYEDIDFKKQKKTYKGGIAQIIQHECDHLDGIII